MDVKDYISRLNAANIAEKADLIAEAQIKPDDRIITEFMAESGPWEVVVNERDNAYWMIVSKLPGDLYISTLGSYDSWDSTNFDGSMFQQVTPTEKTITIYQPTK